MKRLACTVAALALVAPQMVLAQDGDHQRPQNSQQDRAGPRPGGSHQPGNDRSATARPGTDKGNQWHNNAAPNNRGPQTHATPDQRDHGRNMSGQNMSGPNMAGQHNPGRTQRPAGYHPPRIQRHRAPAFHYPSGYRYRRWSAGAILPRIFLSNYYFYTSWYDLGFGPPPPGDAWVRYGPDLLLVNIRTGRVVDVVYGVFY